MEIVFVVNVNVKGDMQEIFVRLRMMITLNMIMKLMNMMTMQDSFAKSLSLSLTRGQQWGE